MNVYIQDVEKKQRDSFKTTIQLPCQCLNTALLAIVAIMCHLHWHGIQCDLHFQEAEIAEMRYTLDSGIQALGIESCPKQAEIITEAGRKRCCGSAFLGDSFPTCYGVLLWPLFRPS